MKVKLQAPCERIGTLWSQVHSKKEQNIDNIHVDAFTKIMVNNELFITCPRWSVKLQPFDHTRGVLEIRAVRQELLYLLLRLEVEGLFVIPWQTQPHTHNVITNTYSYSNNNYCTARSYTHTVPHTHTPKHTQLHTATHAHTTYSHTHLHTRTCSYTQINNNCAG